MAINPVRLGRCPICESAIPPGAVLIEYETSDGPACYAECPSCGDVVHPTER